MNIVKLHVDSFTVVGIEGRTTNAAEASGHSLIGPMWKRLYEENLLSRIPKKFDQHIVAVYSDYESDKDGPYTYLLGAKVSSSGELPAGMVSRKVLSGDYAMFTSENAPLPDGVVALWKQIWSLEKPEQLRRAYKTDFEVYESPAPTNTRVSVYIGLKK